MLKVRIVGPNDDSDSWYPLYVNTDFVAYIELITEGDFKGHYMLGFNTREYVLHRDDLNSLFG